MAIHEDEVEMTKRALPEYLAVSRAGVEGGGLGFPTATLLFAIVDIIGSFHRGDASFTVKVDGQKVPIGGTNDHLRILNSHYFGDPDGFALSGSQINRLYRLARSPVTHNALLGEGCALAEGEPKRTALQEIDGVLWVYLPEFWTRCDQAVTKFLAVAHTVIPGSEVVRELRAKEASQGVSFKAAVEALRALPFGGTITVTAMARPDSGSRP